MMRAYRLGLIFGAAALAAVLVQPRGVVRAAQNAQQPGGSIRVQVNVVNLFATVRDKRTKQIVSNLEQTDFKVSEDNAEQKIHAIREIVLNADVDDVPVFFHGFARAPLPKSLPSHILK